MPIVIAEESWEQTNLYVIVHLSLKNASKKTLDVLSTPTYIKISHLPFIFERYLFAEVDEAKTVVEITPSTVTLRLVKKFPCTWPDVKHPNNDCKKAMHRVREEALKFEQQRVQNESKSKKDMRRERENLSIQQHMEKQSWGVTNVTKAKDAEKEKAIHLLGLEQWGAADEAAPHNSSEKDLQEATPTEANDEKDQADNICYSDDAIEELVSKIAAVDEKRATKKTSRKSSHKLSVDMTCPVRAASTISFTPTCRIFPTPKRESQTEQEEDWLKKQNQFRKVLEEGGTDCDDLHSLVLRDPLCIKTKGDKFLDAGDWDSATSCYSYAVQAGAQLPAIFLNRGLCHVRKKNLHKVLEDMSKALDLLQPAVAANAKDRLKAHWRRAVAFAFMGLFAQSLIEYQGARAIDSQNEDLQRQEGFVRGKAGGTEEEKGSDLGWMLTGDLLQRS
ncbi:hypothetical protein RvY_13964 [Ramazzottius varieornatus]|uniref:CS domain-containing protein n=1 Tax=Ramazzottius varieornatus TaxID=947166 RepID=A0A1D1VPS5_RAMVA|nr:hypothetical protein RvY_13964 [Ramazzottius varieornatus]